jgi:hypothetical protein
MERTKKQVNPEDLTKIKDLEKQYQELTIEYGQLMIDKMITEQHLKAIEISEENIKQRYLNCQTSEADLGEYLSKTYGSGELNLETGEFFVEN